MSPAAPDITLESEDGLSDAVQVPQEGVTIGRTRPADVVIESRLISKLHARLRRAGDGVILEDLGSPNGTFVNGRRIHAPHTLRDGDTIGIAGVRRYRVRLRARAVEPGAPAQPVEPPPPVTRHEPEPTVVRRPDLSLHLHGPSGSFQLGPGAHVIGRQKGVQVFIDDLQISRAHALVTIAGLRVIIEDQSSANGTFVNGELISGPRALRSGDSLRFGDLAFAVTITG